MICSLYQKVLYFRPFPNCLSYSGQYRHNGIFFALRFRPDNEMDREIPDDQKLEFYPRMMTSRAGMIIIGDRLLNRNLERGSYTVDIHFIGAFRQVYDVERDVQSDRERIRITFGLC